MSICHTSANLYLFAAVVKVALSPGGSTPLANIVASPVRIIASPVHMIASPVFIITHCMVVYIS